MEMLFNLLTPLSAFVVVWLLSFLAPGLRTEYFEIPFGRSAAKVSVIVVIFLVLTMLMLLWKPVGTSLVFLIVILFQNIRKHWQRIEVEIESDKENSRLK